LRACISKARLWRDLGMHEEARGLLAPVYHSFSEGRDTVDMCEARSLLEEVARPQQQIC
jgi:predicted ATPase